MQSGGLRQFFCVVEREVIMENKNLTIAECLKRINENSEEVMEKLRKYVVEHGVNDKKGEPCDKKTLNEKFAKKENEGFYVRKSISKGNNGKEPYVWLDILYKGLHCSIATVWSDVDNSSKNPHHYFGQLCFINNVNPGKVSCSSPYSGDTTIDEIYEHAIAFQAFLNKEDFQTINQKCSSRTHFTIDNVLNGVITPEAVIELFGKWLEKELAKL
jgi:hypothetical protein